MPDCGFPWRLYIERTVMLEGALIGRIAGVGCPGCGGYWGGICRVVRV